MEFRVWVETRLGDRILERELVAQVQRTAAGIGPEEVGLSLEEGKTVLRQVQAHMIQRQVEALAAAARVVAGKGPRYGHWMVHGCRAPRRSFSTYMRVGAAK